MNGSYHVEGFAIASADGKIADAARVMPDSLKFAADARFFEAAMDEVDLVAHGRRSHEGHPNSDRRRRFVMTRSVPALAPEGSSDRVWLWNPARMPIEAACAAIGLSSARVAILGGPEAYDLFLPRYDAFSLSRAERLRLPGGATLFSRMGDGDSPEAALSGAGLVPGPKRWLEQEAGLSYVRWTRESPAEKA